MSHLNSLKSLRHRTNLIQLNQDGVTAAHLNTLGQTLCIGNEQVVADQLYLVAQTGGQLLPAFPVFLIQTILDGDNRILLTKVSPVLDELLCCKLCASLRQFVEAFALLALPLGRSCVHGNHEVLARLVSGLLYSLQNGLNSLYVRL